MELKRAKEVLEDLWGEKKLKIMTTYPSANGKIHICDSVGYAEIEAIATWMRDPEGVVKA